MMNENDNLKATFSQTYNELLEAFEHFKRQIEEDHAIKQTEREQELLKQIEQQSQRIDLLFKENTSLKDKMSRIKDVFDLTGKSPCKTTI